MDITWGHPSCRVKTLRHEDSAPPFPAKSQRIWTEKSTFSVWESLARGGVSYGVFTAIEGGLEERGIKQTWLAERLGKSFCIVNSYVCNRRQPSLEVLFEIAKILNVDPKELISNQTSH